MLQILYETQSPLIHAFRQRISNDRFRSARHRVLKKTAEPRYSIPFFYEMGTDTVVATLESCVEEGETAKVSAGHAGELCGGGRNSESDWWLRWRAVLMKVKLRR